MTSEDPRLTIQKLNRLGLIVLAAMFGSVGVWLVASELSGAVIAPGVIVVENSVKKVQHPTGGVVSEILVKEGDAVVANQVLVRLDDTVAKATVGVIRSQIDELEARQSRLTAELNELQSVTFPDRLIDRIREPVLGATLSAERRLFESRRLGRTGQRAQLTERIAQSNQEIRGLSSQKAAKEREVEYIAQELVGVNELYSKNLVALPRVMLLSRDKARLEGELGQYDAEMARARGKIAETELQILQIDKEFITDALKELRDTQGKLAELNERLTAAEDQLRRVEIRAPQAGYVHQLAVHTRGGVIANGEVLMQVVPQTDRLIIEAKVAPPDIDQVVTGANATVKIQAGEQRAHPDIQGKLILVSADLTREPPSAVSPGASYFSVRVAIDRERAESVTDLKLVPGMSAEVFIQTASRSALQYLLKPLQIQMARAFRER